jgi:hypothetical protein
VALATSRAIGAMGSGGSARGSEFADLARFRAGCGVRIGRRDAWIVDVRGVAAGSGVRFGRGVACWERVGMGRSEEAGSERVRGRSHGLGRARR